MWITGCFWVGDSLLYIPRKKRFRDQNWKFHFYFFVLNSWWYVHSVATSYFSMPSFVMIVTVERKRKAIFILTCSICSSRYGVIKGDSKHLIWILSHPAFGLHPWGLIYEFLLLLLSNSLMLVLSCYIGNRNRQESNKMKWAEGHLKPMAYRNYFFNKKQQKYASILKLLLKQ